MSISNDSNDFFTAPLLHADPDVARMIAGDARRLEDRIELIASENLVSRAVLDAQGSVLTNKYAEGYPGRRYYGGCGWVDQIEDLACERAKRLFNASFANVQPHSGSQANQAVFLALLSPGDPILSMSLDAGGHLTHGAPPNQSGKWFSAHHYGVGRDDGLINMEQVASIAKRVKPKLIIAGGSSYSRIIDFAAFREIADSVGACLLADMSHFSGLVASGHYPNPVDHAHVATTTTHKILRGPRGGLILTNDADIAKRIDKAIFPGLQGGPLMHVIAAKAVALGEALRPEFKSYAQRVIDGAKALAGSLADGGCDIVSGGTDTHLALVDLRPMKLTGRAMQDALETVGITCNRNGVPFDPEKPTITSGIRVGSPPGATRGFGPGEFTRIGGWIVEIARSMQSDGHPTPQVAGKVRDGIRELTGSFPIYRRQKQGAPEPT